MTLRHNVKNDPWALAFGRNKLRQLRDTLFDDEPRDEHYVSRRYAINGRIIRVRIAGEDEFVWSQRVAAPPQPPVGDWVLLATATRSLATESWSIELGPLIAADVMGYTYGNTDQWILYFGNGEAYSPADPPPMESVIRIVDQATGELISDYSSLWPDATAINWELNYEGPHPPGTVFEIYARPGLYGTYIGY